MRSWVITALALVVAAPGHAAGPGRVTMDEAIALALKQNPMVHGGQAQIDEAKAARKETRARFLPIVRLEGNVIVWDSPMDLDFLGSLGAAPDISTFPPPDSAYEVMIAGMLTTMGEPMRMRELVTGEVGISVVHPLSILFSMGNTFELLDLAVKQARVARTKVKHDLALQTATIYLRTLQAMTMLDNARIGVREMEAQLARVKSLIRGDVLTDNDRLKLEVAVAARKQEVIRGETNVAIARSGLATLMGLPVDADVAPIPTQGRPLPRHDLPLEQAYDRAMKGRAVMEQLKTGRKQAALATSLEKKKYIPSITAIASYKHSEGSSFADTNSFFVGLMLQWNVWEWGAKSHAIDKARARERQLVQQEKMARAGIRLEIRRARLEFEASVKALGLAGQALNLAEASAKLERKRFEAADATATDLVVAETAVATARNNRTAAYYNCLVADAAYRRAVGLPLTSKDPKSIQPKAPAPSSGGTDDAKP